MEDKEYQKKELETIYSKRNLSPIFKRNPKHNIGEFSGMMPFIAYKDIMERKYIIRAGKSYDDKDDSNPIISEYSSIEDLVNDGWRLD